MSSSLNLFRVTKWALKITAVLFPVTILAFAALYQPALDDFYFKSLLRERSVLDATIYEYSAWSTRWTSLPLNFLAQKYSWGPFLLFVSGWGLLTFGLYRLLKPIIRSGLAPLPSAIFTSTLLFGLSVAHDDSFFWTCAFPSYFLPFAMLLNCIVILRKDRWQWYDGILLGLMLVYIGGASAPLALLVLLAGITLAVTNFRHLRSRLLTSLPFLLISLLVLLAGTGNENRLAHFSSIGIFESVLLNLKSLTLFWFRHYPWQIASLLLSSYLLSQIVDFSKLSVSPKTFILLLIATNFLYHWPIAYSMGDLGPYRVMWPLMAINTFLLAPLFGHLRVQKFSYWIAPVYLIVFVILFLPGSFRYSQKWKARDQMLLENSSSIPQLPSCYPLKHSEISSDPNHFSQKQIKDWYQVDTIRF